MIHRREDFDIIKIKNGDEKAFRHLFITLYPRLINIASRFVDDEIAKDLVQEVFEEYWIHKEDIDAININSFLFKCIQNKCLNYIKHNAIVEDYAARVRIAEARIAYFNETTDANEILDHIEHSELLNRINLALKKLSPRCEEVFRMYYLEDIDRKEIAVKLDISVRTVEWHIQQALVILRKELIPIAILIFMLKNTF